MNEVAQAFITEARSHLLADSDLAFYDFSEGLPRPT